MNPAVSLSIVTAPTPYYLLSMNDQLSDPTTGRPLDMASITAPLEQLRDCICCPRECHADRFDGKLGYCRSCADFNISSICAHRGEEPVISGQHGICNIFFVHCNMQCVYCQNYQISRNRHSESEKLGLPELVRRVEATLNRGAHAVGFVSPSHFVPQMQAIVNALSARGRTPVYVYNTNGYDKVEMIKTLGETIDVWLPDLKYIENDAGEELSDTSAYGTVACAAIKEMYYQKGSGIRLDDNGCIIAGMIIRHLVLPGYIENSKKVLRWIAEELSPSVHLSLMSQYFPTPQVAGHPQLGRTLTSDEYEEVVDEFQRLGFYRGWVQELDSPSSYRPDFNLEHPFEP
jgi:putative pyruvate formate lyase activating enzyme